jgi:manganese transport protein
MEGFLQIKLSPTLRAFVTRAIAIVPAVIATAWYGSAGASALLIFSQVVLSLQLPFALVPLLLFTTRRRHLGEHAFGRLGTVLIWGAALIVLSLNVWLLQRLIAL